MKALVLAGGKGSNMIPFSATRPKPMIPVAGEPVIGHTLRLLKEAGVRHVNLVTGHRGERLRHAFSDDSYLDMRVTLIDQGAPGGIGKAVLAAKDRFTPGENFFLVYSDTLTTENIFSVTHQTHCLRNEPVAAISHARQSEKYGNVYLDADTRITRLVEKPKKQQGLSNYVLSGVFIMNSSIFALLEKSKGDMVKALGALIKKETFRAAIWDADWLDLAYPWDILAANRALMDQWREARIDRSVTLRGAMVSGAVRIEKGAEISPGAVLEGPCYIGAGSFVGHNALIRPYTSVGARSIIGQSAELKNCVLFPGAQVGRLSFIGDSVIGENADLGAGVMTINHPIDEAEISVTLNRTRRATGLNKLGAFIGDDARIGASNSIAAGSIVKSGVTIDHNISVPRKR